MDMRLNRELVKSERQERAWSQQHLAEACGLGLRTIQRIERTGVASYESVQAIAACLDIQLARLVESGQQPNTRGTIVRNGSTVAGMVGSFIAGAMFMSVQNVVAEEMLLKFGVTEQTGAEDERAIETEVYVDSGTEYEMRIKGGHRLVVLPEILSDNVVSITMSFYEADVQDAEPILSPMIILKSGSEGVIRIGDLNSSELQSVSSPSGIRISVTPTILTVL